MKYLLMLVNIGSYKQKPTFTIAGCWFISGEVNFWWCPPGREWYTDDFTALKKSMVKL